MSNTPFPDAGQTTDSGSVPDGKVCLNELGELAVTKFAVEPVSLPCIPDPKWYYLF